MLSQRLKAARKMNNLTQEALALKVKTTKGTISNYENGYSSPSNEMLNDLADILGVTTDFLLGRTDKPDGKNQKQLSKHDEEEEEFQEFIKNPNIKHWFKELSESPAEQIEELRKIWDIIKNRESGRKPGDKQK